MCYGSDGLYGTGAVLADLAGFSFVTRGKDYAVLDQPEVQCRLHLPADQRFSLPESDLVRTLYDCPDVMVGPTGQHCRVVIATHPSAHKRRIGLTRAGLVYELFFCKLPQDAFTAADVVALYLHRGAFEPALADEDAEQDPDRWCSQAPWGQQAWQIISQWIWNLRLELGHRIEATPMRTTEFAPAITKAREQSTPCSGYAAPTLAASWKAGRLSGRDFALQPDGTLRCPAAQTLQVHERRQEADGSLRLVYAASLRSCRSCALRERCQWNGGTTGKPRQVSVLLHPLVVESSALLWRDWGRRRHRRACMQLVRDQHLEVQLAQKTKSQSYPAPVPAILSRAQRAHFQLSWAERLGRNARDQAEGSVRIKLFGVPDHFADFLGLRAS